MRFKIKLALGSIKLENIVTETAKNVHKLLGENNKWHELENKPFTCSLILGGVLKDKVLNYDDNGYIYLNTEDDEVIDAIMSKDINFTIEKQEVFKGYNLLSVKKVIYNTGGKKNWVTEENKSDFVNYVKTKYCVDIEILKIKNSLVSYKNGFKLPTSDLLIRCSSNNNVNNLFESGIGGSCSIGFGFVEPLKK